MRINPDTLKPNFALTAPAGDVLLDLTDCTTHNMGAAVNFADGNALIDGYHGTVRGFRDITGPKGFGLLFTGDDQDNHVLGLGTGSNGNADWLIGGAGNDTLDSTAKGTIFEGDEGNDTFVLHGKASTIKVHGRKVELIHTDAQPGETVLRQ